METKSNSLSRSLIETQLSEENPKESNGTALKVTLFVIAIVCAGASLYSHFNHLNLTYVIAFSATGGIFLISFIISALCHRSDKTYNDDDPIDLLRGQTAVDKRPLILDKNSAASLVIRPSQTALSNEPVLNDIELFSQMDKKDEHVVEQIGFRIAKKFNNFKLIDEAVREMQPIFDLFKDKPQQFELLAFAILYNSNWNIRSSVEVLEKITWPDESTKTEVLSELIVEKILDNGIEWQKGFISLGGEDGLNTQALFVNMKKILGTGDFVKNKINMSATLIKAIGKAIKLGVEATIQEQSERRQKGEKGVETGVKIVFGQLMECRFPASLIAAILPDLQNLPGLISIDLGDIGVRTKFDAEIEGNNGFGEKDYDVLVGIIKSNPYLFDVKINVDALSKNQQESFMAILQENGNRALQELLVAEKKDDLKLA